MIELKKLKKIKKLCINYYEDTTIYLTSYNIDLDPNISKLCTKIIDNKKTILFDNRNSIVKFIKNIGGYYKKNSVFIENKEGKEEIKLYLNNIPLWKTKTGMQVIFPRQSYLNGYYSNLKNNDNVVAIPINTLSLTGNQVLYLGITIFENIENVKKYSSFIKENTNFESCLNKIEYCKGLLDQIKNFK